MHKSKTPVLIQGDKTVQINKTKTSNNGSERLIAVK